MRIGQTAKWLGISLFFCHPSIMQAHGLRPVLRQVLQETAERTVSSWFGVDMGSVSQGTCDDGYLLRAAMLAPIGDTWRLLPEYAQRRLMYGTDELVAALLRASRKVAARFPGSVLEVGNLSGRFGGPLRFSVSHQAGRDVDLAYYSRMADGSFGQLPHFLPFACTGESFEGPGTYRVDFERTWLLIESLLSDPEIDIQHIFAASCLAGQIRQAGLRLGASREMLGRVQMMMKRPRGGEPHNDHIHVRTYCSRSDLEWGCHNSGGMWDWTRVHEGHYLGKLSVVRQDLQSSQKTRRVNALRVYARYRAPEIIFGLFEGIRRDDPIERALSMQAVARAGDAAVLPALRLRLQQIRDVESASELIRLLGAFDSDPSPASALLLEQIATEPRMVLSIADEKARPTLRHEALESLAYIGRPSNVPGLLRIIEDSDPECRRLADRALQYITNQRGAMLQKPGARRNWLRWWQSMRRKTADDWRVEGFLAAGIQVKRPIYGRASIPSLVTAIERGGYLAFNAQRLLRAHASAQAPEVTHLESRAARFAWLTWLGSLLPVGAVAPDL